MKYAISLPLVDMNGRFSFRSVEFYRCVRWSRCSLTHLDKGHPEDFVLLFFELDVTYFNLSPTGFFSRHQSYVLEHCSCDSSRWSIRNSVSVTYARQLWQTYGVVFYNGFLHSWCGRYRFSITNWVSHLSTRSMNYPRYTWFYFMSDIFLANFHAPFKWSLNFLGCVMIVGTYHHLSVGPLV